MSFLPQASRMDVDDEGDTRGLPSADQCMKLCESFVEFTETDKAMAMMFLQDNDWNLEVAVSIHTRLFIPLLLRLYQ